MVKVSGICITTSTTTGKKKTIAFYVVCERSSELQETGMYDYGARFYMPDIGRWGVVDPLSELQFKYSPYAYTYNNPIFFNDPTGMIGEDPKKTPEFINGGKAKEIEEVVITKVTPKPSQDSSLSFMGINSLSSFHSSQDRWAAMINSSPAALATEQFEKNLANGMGTVFMGGSNIWASSGWAAFDAWLEYQDPEDQEAIATVQYAAIFFQLRHGNTKGVQDLANKISKYEKLADGFGTRKFIKEFNNTTPINTRILFNDITQGGIKNVIKTEKGKIINAVMSDGSRIQLRDFSTKSGLGNHTTIEFIGSQNIKWKFNY